METRKQRRGNCQCCGRQQAVLDTGAMSKHGYTVDHGWFKGVCNGQKHAPLQHDRKVTDFIVTDIRSECDKLEELAHAYRLGHKHPARVSRSSYRRGEDPTVAWEDADKWTREAGLTSAIYNLQNRARAGRAHADMMEQLADAVHGKPLINVEVETGPAPIKLGETRKAPNGKVLKVVRLQGARVYWKDERGFSSWTGSSAWRKYELV